MHAVSESGLLRLAIAKGALQWEDLDSIAGHLPADGEGAGGPAASPIEGRYVRALIAAGFLSRKAVQELTEELERSSQDLTPSLLLPFRPERQAGAGPEGGAGSFPPDFRFLADWQRYRVQSFVGSGGMGTAYKAFDPHLNRFVALKFLHRNDPVQTARFLREARSQARVENGNVCQVYEVGEVEGRPYIAMQYIDGKPLSSLRDELSLEEKVGVVRDVAWAVHAAHRTGLIHRDLKPGNVLVTRDENGAPHPYVVDFGLALDTAEDNLSTTAVLGGTPAYISPEAASGQPLDARSDVYSLGVLLYELLSGSRPFSGLSLANVLVRIAQEEPTALRRLKPELPQDLETVVQRCMEKDRDQRYASARDLAEDLSRFLDGDPIQARPATWSYRLRKRLRKNRLLAGVSAAAVVALAILAVANLYTYLRAREQAELARRFGERIGHMEADMRVEAYIPLHTVSARKAELREELEAIRKEMDGLGAIAKGPGHEALGKGNLALHLYEPAFQNLEEAWKAGQRNADVAEALGEAGSFLIERPVAGSGTGPEGVAARAELQQEYRRRTLSILRQASALEGESSPYLHALVAFYEKSYPETLLYAQRAHERDPRLYRAAQLQARVYAAQAEAAAETGAYSAALALYDRAGEVYASALRIAPSEASLHLGDCVRRARRLEVVLQSGSSLDPELTDAIAACDLALLVDPELSGALTQKAFLYWRRGDEAKRRGQDPTADVAQSINFARAALRIESRDASAYNDLAVSYRTLAQWNLDKGLDPGVPIREGLNAARRAVQLQPGLAATHNTLATAYLVQAQDQQGRGIDPRPALQEAVRSCQHAVKANAQYLPAQINLGSAWKALAEADLARGSDPTRALDQSAAALAEAIRLNPNRATTYNNRGNVYLTLGEYQAARGVDAVPAFIQAAASYRHAVELKPDYAYAHYNLAYTQRSLAQVRLDRGDDPQREVAEAEATLERALVLAPDDADSHLERARLLTIAGRWNLLRGRPARDRFAAAAKALTRAEGLNPRQAEVHYEAARLARFESEAQPKDSRLRIAQGLAAIDRALAINAKEARYGAERGILLTLEAEGQAAPAARSDLFERARIALEDAVRRNPLLNRELAPWRERTKGTGKPA